MGYNPSTKETDINTDEFKLKPAKEIFYEDEDFVDEKSEEEINEEIRKEKLMEQLGDIIKYRINGGDPIQQIENITTGSREAKDIAIKYLQTAYNGG